MNATAISPVELDTYDAVRAFASMDGAETLSSLFDDVCARFPERVAVTFGGESMTYAELQMAAGRVANSLSSLNLQGNHLVAIYMERSMEMVVAMLGVIKSGNAYLPIDPGYPEQRVCETLADASPAAVLTDAVRAEKLRATCGNVLILEETLLTPSYPTDAIESQANDLAYVIYTSGSTGKPKGVMVSHRNVVRLLTQTSHWFGFDENDVWTMFHSFAFDFSVWEIWGCLLTGGRLVIVPFAVSRSADEFYALLADEGVTVLNQTPTAFGQLMQVEAASRPRSLALRYMIFGGEALNLRSVLPWFARHGDDGPQLINMYGITETTVHVTYRRIYEHDARHETESLIGEPIPDLQIHLLNDALKPVVPGEAGEIWIGGAGVALGYLNRPELTAERFVRDPSDAQGRLYRSGDLARRRADGELVYLGRADRQVKINGFRIELGEIEATLTAFAGVTQACVIARNDAGSGQRLAAYFVGAQSVEEELLREFVAKALPVQMRPASFTRLSELPINANGKVDREALPEPQKSAAKRGDVLPESSLETQVAAVWRKVLHNDSVGLMENFFDAGGSSLDLVSVRKELQTLLGRTIPVTWMFEHTTIRSLAARLAEVETEVFDAQAAMQYKMAQQRDSFARMKVARGASL
jgi:amino acid adenylation domain-containing protein